MGSASNSTPQAPLVVIGAGLAGCEAAWQAAQRGVDVVLFEMKPLRMSPAHVSQQFAELVCSNSLRSDELVNAVGLLKEEMRQLGSLILSAADATAVPAGRALAVDREKFGEHVTRAIEEHPRIEVRRELVSEIPDDPLVVLATGPLTAPELAGKLQQLVGEEHLYFYDAIAPTVYADSIDTEIVFRASRYEEGEGDYLNCPLDREQYDAFVSALLAAETVPLHSFETALYFEGCLPVEEIARRGPRTLAYGPMKPVGLVDPAAAADPTRSCSCGRKIKPASCTTWSASRRRCAKDSSATFCAPCRVSRMPCLRATARCIAIPTSTRPKQLQPSLEFKQRPGLYVAGQIAGVEGYVESAALGWLAGVNAARAACGQAHLEPPPETAHGALLAHLMHAKSQNFQPMNVNYGLFPLLEGAGRRMPKREKQARMAERALEALASFKLQPGVMAQ